MKANFWFNRWKNNQIGFHSDEVNPEIIEFLCHMKENTQKGSPLRYDSCFVPLCGKSHDLVYLANYFDEVVGVELSEIAVTDFFEEQQLEYTVSVESNYTLYTSGKYKLYQGDIFELGTTLSKEYDLIYDRAALIAMPSDMRQRYVDNYKKYFIYKKTKILLISLSYSQDEMNGPPFAVEQNEINTLYGPDFCISNLEQKDILEKFSKFKDKGLSKLAANVYLIQIE